MRGCSSSWTASELRSRRCKCCWSSFSSSAAERAPVCRAAAAAAAIGKGSCWCSCHGCDAWALASSSGTRGTSGLSSPKGVDPAGPVPRLWVTGQPQQPGMLPAVAQVQGPCPPPPPPPAITSSHLHRLPPPSTSTSSTAVMVVATTTAAAARASRLAAAAAAPPFV
jgi:hypothetical protein